MRKALLALILAGVAPVAMMTASSPATAAAVLAAPKSVDTTSAVIRVDYNRRYYDRGYRHYRYRRPADYGYYAPRAQYRAPAYYGVPAPAYYAPPIVYYPPPVVVYYPPPVVYGAYPPAAPYRYGAPAAGYYGGYSDW